MVPQGTFCWGENFTWLWANENRSAPCNVLTPCGTPSVGRSAQHLLSSAAMLGAQGVILCIDDEAINLLVRKAVLQSVGYAVLTASSGVEGLEIFQRYPIAAVIVDFQMPEMNGTEVAAEMKRIRPHVPIIMLSAYTDLTPDLLRPTDAYLIKGDDPSALFDALANLTPQSTRSSRTQS